MNMESILKMITTFWYLWLLVLLVGLYSIFKPRIKGYMGEKAISAILAMLDSNKYKVINDVVLCVEGKTSQIDHVVVSNYGIFVIETKNYKGLIYGDDYSDYWTQVIFKRKEKLYNPVRQNYGHVQALKQHLVEYPDIPYIPIVVFSINADLKVKTNSEVVYSVNLLKTIKKYETILISDYDKDLIYSKIMELNNNTKEVRKQHVQAIHKRKEEKEIKIDENVCPKCGSKLVVKKGKYGEFKGCSSYPKCRFTV